MKVKFINSTKLRQNLADIFRVLDGDTTLIISRRGKQTHALIDIDAYEDLLAASNPEYLKDIAQARQQVASGDILNYSEVLENL